ncbi:MAG: glycosyltransferase family 2 protein [Verrucomicrobiia bacterium]
MPETTIKCNLRGVDFSIVTPSFRNSKWLKLCIASIADQGGVTLEHIVQDAGSDDGTLEWLVHDRRVRAYVEKDNGMYDAINRGFRRSTGEFLAYLNCDEQYLPGALQAVQNFFRQHPGIDVVFSHTVVINTDGTYNCHRKAILPLKGHIWYRMPVFTCSLFQRRSVLEERGIYLDTRWRDAADMFWVMEMLKHKVPMAILQQFTSAFTETGENMNLKPNALRENEIKNAMIPRWVKAFAPAIVFHHRLRCLTGGSLFQKPFSYSVYTLADPDRRISFRVDKPKTTWKRPSSLPAAATP